MSGRKFNRSFYCDGDTGCQVGFANKRKLERHHCSGPPPMSQPPEEQLQQPTDIIANNNECEVGIRYGRDVSEPY
jgi:hypothetical protein